MKIQLLATVIFMASQSFATIYIDNPSFVKFSKEYCTWIGKWNFDDNGQVIDYKEEGEDYDIHDRCVYFDTLPGRAFHILSDAPKNVPLHFAVEVSSADENPVTVTVAIMQCPCDRPRIESFTDLDTTLCRCRILSQKVVTVKGDNKWHHIRSDYPAHHRDFPAEYLTTPPTYKQFLYIQMDSDNLVGKSGRGAGAYLNYAQVASDLINLGGRGTRPRTFERPWSPIPVNWR